MFLWFILDRAEASTTEALPERVPGLKLLSGEASTSVPVSICVQRSGDSVSPARFTTDPDSALVGLILVMKFNKYNNLCEIVFWPNSQTKNY